jgi:hypothetical protein
MCYSITSSTAAYFHLQAPNTPNIAINSIRCYFLPDTPEILGRKLSVNNKQTFNHSQMKVKQTN